VRLEVMSPTERISLEGVIKVKAEGPLGCFCLLPRHIDFASTLVPGIVSYVKADGVEELVATDEGFLVKKGDEILVSVLSAVWGRELGGLKRAVVEKIEALDEEERKSRETLARLEADFMRRFGEAR
jgi:F-type H+-transporting ATPase subunit epsilon